MYRSEGERVQVPTIGALNVGGIVNENLAQAILVSW